MANSSKINSQGLGSLRERLKAIRSQGGDQLALKKHLVEESKAEDTTTADSPRVSFKPRKLHEVPTPERSEGTHVGSSSQEERATRPEDLVRRSKAHSEVTDELRGAIGESVKDRLKRHNEVESNKTYREAGLDLPSEEGPDDRILGSEPSYESSEGGVEKYVGNLKNKLGASPSSLEKVRQFIAGNPRVIGQHILESNISDDATRNKAAMPGGKSMEPLTREFHHNKTEPLPEDGSMQEDDGVRSQDELDDESLGGGEMDFAPSESDASIRAPREQYQIKGNSTRPDRMFEDRERASLPPTAIPSGLTEPTESKPNPMLERILPSLDLPSYAGRLAEKGQGKRTIAGRLQDPATKIHLRQYSSTRPVSVRTSKLSKLPPEEKAPTETKETADTSNLSTLAFMRKHKVSPERMKEIKNKLWKQAQERKKASYASTSEE